MGSCSNRSDTPAERLGKYAQKVVEANRTRSGWYDNYENFQSTIGAEIRGTIGVEKGNAFIKAIKDTNR